MGPNSWDVKSLGVSLVLGITIYKGLKFLRVQKNVGVKILLASTHFACSNFCVGLIFLEGSKLF